MGVCWVVEKGGMAFGSRPLDGILGLQEEMGRVFVGSRERQLALGRGLCGKMKGAIYLHSANCLERFTTAGHIIIWRDQWPRLVRYLQLHFVRVVQSLASQALTCALMLCVKVHLKSCAWRTGAGCASALSVGA